MRARGEMSPKFHPDRKTKRRRLWLANECMRALFILCFRASVRITGSYYVRRSLWLANECARYLFCVSVRQCVLNPECERHHRVQAPSLPASEVGALSLNANAIENTFEV